jgi:hypothetical protein
MQIYPVKMTNNHQYSRKRLINVVVDLFNYPAPFCFMRKIGKKKIASVNYTDDSLTCFPMSLRFKNNVLRLFCCINRKNKVDVYSNHDLEINKNIFEVLKNSVKIVIERALHGKL